ncbi:MAG: hypothetical protein A4S09_06690 [Proteobacteria bacterium SG_bin7]|nr:MAG: hypothetical protein A4S09_06690 [Proteobacteria bacterium SG_bin7]
MGTGAESQTKATKSFTVEFFKHKAPVRLEWTEQGLNKIFLGPPNSAASESESKTPKEISYLISQLKLYFSGKLKSFDFHWLDYSNCTGFQKKVYMAASKIPFGKTKTYSEIAAAIGQPKAVRAVGTALGKNPWILLVPCHRVKGKSGLGGFSAPGGVKTKQQLLTLES